MFGDRFNKNVVKEVASTTAAWTTTSASAVPWLIGCTASGFAKVKQMSADKLNENDVRGALSTAVSTATSVPSLLGFTASRELAKVKEMSDDEFNGNIVKGGAIVTAVATTASVPWFMGFTASGVAKASIAAGIQSGLGNVAGSSAFAAAQSVGATTILGTAVPVTVAGAGVAAVGYGGYKLYQSKYK